MNTDIQKSEINSKTAPQMKGPKSVPVYHDTA